MMVPILRNVEHGRCLHGARVGQMMQAFAECAVTDLIVVLQEQHKGAGRQMCAGFSPRRAMAIGLALKRKTLTQAARQLVRRVVSEFGVIRVGFAS